MSQEAVEATQAGEGEDETNVPQPDELQLLKQRAKMLGIQFSNNIKLEALRLKVAEKLAPVEDNEPEEEEENNEPAALNPLAGDKVGAKPNAKMTKRQKLLSEAMKLIRCRITNLDPKKKDLPGEIFCVGNKFIGTVKKFIPYGEVTDNGYHIPKVLYDELESRKFLHIQTSKKAGQIQVKTSYAKEFAIEVLPQLTPEELAKLASAQLAANNT